MPITQKQNKALILIIETFIKTDKRDTKPKYLRKAIDLINYKLGIPCCVEVNLTTSIGGSDDNNFTNTIKNLLNTMYVPAEKNVLIKAKQILQNALNGCC